MTLKEVRRARKKAYRFLQKAKIVITQEEKESMEVSDFGLNDFEHFGFEIVVYENNDRYCAKELILFPGQTCPEHRHPKVSEKNIGKQETFRCRWGEVYLYVKGDPSPRPKAVLPEGHEKYFTAWREIILRPSDQYTLPPDSLHWLQAGDKGAIVSEFSSTSTDENDIFTNPGIQRSQKIE
ncbi:MAG: D-lyxose/D-mannose family sugar isomerase [Candidatus Aminicenantes bacterium]|nr:D-lyxose/D-mannose family sugar isomerase [Candidatus Aminicenantes bacterium]